MLENKKAIKVKGFTLMNADKIERALKGSPNDKGMFIGGVEKSDGSFDEMELLVEYDRIGGWINKGSDKVRTGSFYDFKAKKAHETPKVEYEFRVNGEVVFVPEGKELPGEIRAAKMVDEMKKEKKVTKKKAKKTE